MIYSSIKMLMFIHVYVPLCMRNGLSWLVTTMLIPKLGPQIKKNPSFAPTRECLIGDKKIKGGCLIGDKNIKGKKEKRH